MERSIGVGRKVVPVVFGEFQMDLCKETPGVFNEKGLEKGRFGWCFVCRAKAEFYCKDLRLAICSIACKKKLAEMDGSYIYKGTVSIFIRDLLKGI